MSSTGEKRDCVCKRARHEHGTRTAYVVDKCRCEPCREAATAYERNRRRQTLYGRYDVGRVDAEPVRAHVRYLMENGVSYKQVAKLSGVSLSAVGALLYGRPERGHAPYPRVAKSTADKILAVRPSLAGMADGRNIDATGTHRRIQALVAIGWSLARIGQRIGISPTNMSSFMRTGQCSAGKAKAVRELYNELWNSPQSGAEQRSRISANRAKNYAKAQGWLPPLAWDDETIDDPAAQPSVFEETPMVHGEERIGDIEFLIRTGAGQTEILSRLGFKNLGALERLCHRYGRGDVVRKMKNLRDLERVA